jgi:hypothetical protein
LQLHHQVFFTFFFPFLLLIIFHCFWLYLFYKCLAWTMSLFWHSIILFFHHFLFVLWSSYHWSFIFHFPILMSLILKAPIFCIHFLCALSKHFSESSHLNFYFFCFAQLHVFNFSCHFFARFSWSSSFHFPTLHKLYVFTSSCFVWILCLILCELFVKTQFLL